MLKNSKLLYCSRQMHQFMEANYIASMQKLFEISLCDLILMPNFPPRLLNEWVLLRDKFNVLCEN